MRKDDDAIPDYKPEGLTDDQMNAQDTFVANLADFEKVRPNIEMPILRTSSL